LRRSGKTAFLEYMFAMHNRYAIGVLIVVVIILILAFVRF